MQQVIFGGYISTLSTTLTRYTSISGGYTWITVIGGRQQAVSTAGKISNLYIEQDAVTGDGDDTYTYTLMVNGSPTALTCAIVGASASNNDVSHKIDVVAGDLVSLKVVPTTTGTINNTPNVQWTMQFAGTTAMGSLILGNGVAYTATNYLSLADGYALNICAINNMPTLFNFFIKMGANPKKKNYQAFKLLNL